MMNYPGEKKTTEQQDREDALSRKTNRAFRPHRRESPKRNRRFSSQSGQLGYVPASRNPKLHVGILPYEMDLCVDVDQWLGAFVH